MTKLQFLASLANRGPYGHEDKFIYSDTPCKSIYDISGKAHNGMYSQQKKLRKGAGHKKLTRAQRKRGY